MAVNLSGRVASALHSLDGSLNRLSAHLLLVPARHFDTKVELHEVSVPARTFSSLLSVTGYDEVMRTKVDLSMARAALGGRTVWHVSDNPRRGGVAEILRTMLPYQLSEGIRSRWVTLSAPPEVRSFNKALYYCLCGVASPSSWQQFVRRKSVYDSASRSAAFQLMAHANREDVIVVHDHQLAGLIPHLRDAGYTVVWRVHLGITDAGSEASGSAWDFICRYVRYANAHILSYPEMLPRSASRDVTRYVVEPSIDPLSPKNVPLDRYVSPGQLIAQADIIKAPHDDTPGVDIYRQLLVRRQATVLRRDQPIPPEGRLVTQVSRWDRVKNTPGLIRSFVDHVDSAHGAYLALVGPETVGDPQGEEVFKECQQIRERLSPNQQDRVHLIQLPADNATEHAVLVNDIQAFSTVVAQRSFAEGFGLTVTEAAWKRRPVVASAVGGLCAQVEDGNTGLLVHSASDGDFGEAINRLLADPRYAASLGMCGQDRTRRWFLTTSHLRRVASVLTDLCSSTG